MGKKQNRRSRGQRRIEQADPTADASKRETANKADRKGNVSAASDTPTPPARHPPPTSTATAPPLIQSHSNVAESAAFAVPPTSDDPILDLPPMAWAGADLLSLRRRGWFRNMIGRGGTSTVKPSLIKRGSFNGRPATLIMLSVILASDDIPHFAFLVSLERLRPRQQIIAMGLVPPTLLATQLETGSSPNPPPSATSAPMATQRRPPRGRAAKSAPGNLLAQSTQPFVAPPDPVPQPASSDAVSQPATIQPEVHPGSAQLYVETTMMREFVSGNGNPNAVDVLQVAALGPSRIQAPALDANRDLSGRWGLGLGAMWHGLGLFFKRAKQEKDQFKEITGPRLSLRMQGPSQILVKMVPAVHLDAGCPQAFQVGFVVVHNGPVSIDVKPALQRAHEKLRGVEGKTHTLAHNTPQVAPVERTCALQGGHPCRPDCVEFNSTHMTADVWKRKLCWWDLQEFESPLNDQVSVSTIG